MSQGFDEVSCTNVTCREREKKEKKRKVEQRRKNCWSSSLLVTAQGGVEVFMFSHAMNSDLLIAETD